MLKRYFMLPIIFLLSCQKNQLDTSAATNAEFVTTVEDSDGKHGVIHIPSGPGGFILEICASGQKPCQLLMANEDTLSLKGMPAGKYHLKLRRCEHLKIDSGCPNVVSEADWQQVLTGSRESQTAQKNEFENLLLKNDAAVHLYAAFVRHYLGLQSCKVYQQKFEPEAASYIDYVKQMGSLGPVLGVAAIFNLLSEDANAFASMNSISTDYALTTPTTTAPKEGDYRTRVVTYQFYRPSLRELFADNWRIDWRTILALIMPSTNTHTGMYIERYVNNKWVLDLTLDYPDLKSAKEYLDGSKGIRSEHIFDFKEETIVEFKKWLRDSEYAPVPNNRQDILKRKRLEAKILIGNALNNGKEMETFSRTHKDLIAKSRLAYLPYVEAKVAMEGRLAFQDYNGKILSETPLQALINDIYQKEAVGLMTPSMEKDLKDSLESERERLMVLTSDGKWEKATDPKHFAMLKNYQDQRALIWKQDWYRDLDAYKKAINAISDKESHKTMRSWLGEYMLLEAETYYLRNNTLPPAKAEFLIQQNLVVEDNIRRLLGVTDGRPLATYFGFKNDLWKMRKAKNIFVDIYGDDPTDPAVWKTFVDSNSALANNGIDDPDTWQKKVNDLLNDYEARMAELHAKSTPFGEGYNRFRNNCSSSIAASLNTLTATKQFARSSDLYMSPSRLHTRIDEYVNGKPSLAKKVLTPTNIALSALMTITTGIGLGVGLSKLTETSPETVAAMQCIRDDQDVFFSEIEPVLASLATVKTAQSLLEQLQSLSAGTKN